MEGLGLNRTHGIEENLFDDLTGKIISLEKKISKMGKDILNSPMGTKEKEKEKKEKKIENFRRASASI